MDIRLFVKINSSIWTLFGIDSWKFSSPELHLNLSFFEYLGINTSSRFNSIIKCITISKVYRLYLY